MRVRSFSHVAITVSDFNQAVRFYWEVFGAPLVGVSDTPADRVRGFFGVEASQPTCKIGWVRVPGGATIEIFEFQPQQPPAEVVWNRIGASTRAAATDSLQTNLPELCRRRRTSDWNGVAMPAKLNAPGDVKGGTAAGFTAAGELR